VRNPLSWLRADVDANDPSSLDPEMVDLLAPYVDAACRFWFRLDVRGIERMPDGPALIVVNHNSGIAYIEMMGAAAQLMAAGRGDRDRLHALGHDAIVDAPILGPFLVRSGTVRAGHAQAAAVFARGRKVMVCPGGNYEAFRPWTERNRVDFGGHKGFLRLARRHGVPVVPLVMHGGHNGFVVLRSGRRLARWTGLRKALRTDSWPLYLGLPWGVAFGPWPHLPLPVRCTAELLDPIHLGGFDDDEVGLQRAYDHVVGTMQVSMDRLAG
jgi:1-acyl-sn-glycerol-3-phosphate acyltransferase